MQDKASKCRLHPGTSAVADCAGCGAGLCIDCAIPVRGSVLGPECLPEELRADAPPIPETARQRMRLRLSGAGFAIATVASLLPWKKYGLGSGPFGAWGLTPRWSVFASIVAILGLILWAVVSLAGLKPGFAWRGGLRVFAVLVAAGAVLHLLRRPGFGPHSFGPWVAIAGGTLAFAGTLARSGHATEVPETAGG